MGVKNSVKYCYLDTWILEVYLEEVDNKQTKLHKRLNWKFAKEQEMPGSWNRKQIIVEIKDSETEFELDI